MLVSRSYIDLPAVNLGYTMSPVQFAEARGNNTRSTLSQAAAAIMP